jgi:O-antigen/teichoic acid export membrane protein
VAAAALVLAAYPAVFLFFGDRYLGLIMPLIILVPGTVFLGQSRLLTEYFYGIGRCYQKLYCPH